MKDVSYLDENEDNFRNKMWYIFNAVISILILFFAVLVLLNFAKKFSKIEHKTYRKETVYFPFIPTDERKVHTFNFSFGSIKNYVSLTFRVSAEKNYQIPLDTKLFNATLIRITDGKKTEIISKQTYRFKWALNSRESKEIPIRMKFPLKGNSVRFLLNFTIHGRGIAGFHGTDEILVSLHNSEARETRRIMKSSFFSLIFAIVLYIRCQKNYVSTCAFILSIFCFLCSNPFIESFPDYVNRILLVCFDAFYKAVIPSIAFYHIKSESIGKKMTLGILAVIFIVQAICSALLYCEESHPLIFIDPQLNVEWFNAELSVTIFQIVVSSFLLIASFFFVNGSRRLIQILVFCLTSMSFFIEIAVLNDYVASFLNNLVNLNTSQLRVTSFFAKLFSACVISLMYTTPELDQPQSDMRVILVNSE